MSLPRNPGNAAWLVSLMFFLAWSSTVSSQQEEAESPGLGVAVEEADIAGFGLIVGGDGEALPPGSGTAAQGEQVYRSRCVSCHGENGEGVSGNTRLVGGSMQSEEEPLRTVGSYWPHATTLFDFIRRAMPADEPKSLTDDEVYQLSAYLLYLNDIVARDFVLDQDSLPEVRMPNADGFVDRSDARQSGD